MVLQHLGTTDSFLRSRFEESLLLSLDGVKVRHHHAVDTEKLLQQQQQQQQQQNAPKHRTSNRTACDECNRAKLKCEYCPRKKSCVVCTRRGLPCSLASPTAVGRAAIKKAKQQQQQQQQQPEEFEVEALLKRKESRGKRSYLVRWKGYGAEEDTWEPEEHLLQSGASSLVTEFTHGQGQNLSAERKECALPKRLKSRSNSSVSKSVGSRSAKRKALELSDEDCDHEDEHDAVDEDADADADAGADTNGELGELSGAVGRAVSVCFSALPAGICVSTKGPDYEMGDTTLRKDLHGRYYTTWRSLRGSREMA
eukprot:COSAG05_NODE_1332_length_5154_cov_7.919090_2_plen_311_part_00